MRVAIWLKANANGSKPSPSMANDRRSVIAGPPSHFHPSRSLGHPRQTAKRRAGWPAYSQMIKAKKHGTAKANQRNLSLARLTIRTAGALSISWEVLLGVLVKSAIKVRKLSTKAPAPLRETGANIRAVRPP